MHRLHWRVTQTLLHINENIILLYRQLPANTGYFASHRTYRFSCHFPGKPGSAGRLALE